MKFKDLLDELFTTDMDRQFDAYANEIINEMSQPDYKLEQVKKEIISVGLEEIIDYIGIEKFENIIRKKKFNKLLNGKNES